ncbi:cyclophilin-like domain-containing protein, partial [Clohesyomyces aquaticus]
TPITSRNFLQLCLDGYYDNTVFHRLVKGFIIQGGDPTGTGQGGESAYDGEPFADEFHSRLKFNRRGLLGMANTGKKNDNGSQFFFTLGNTPELTGKNTLFGRIAGDTIYNLMKMAEADIADGSEDRPMYPTKITGTEIIINPFEDMVKRARFAQRTEPEAKKAAKKPKRKAGKVLLSFGGDEAEEEAPIPKKPKYNTQLVSAGEDVPSASNNVPKPTQSRAERAIPILKQSRKSPSPSPSPPPPKKAAAKPVQEPPPKAERPSSPATISGEESPEPQEQTRIESVNAQIASVIASMKRKAPAHNTEPLKKKSALEAMIPATSTRARKRGAAANTSSSEKATLDLLSAFKSKLESAPVEDKKMLSPPPVSEVNTQHNGAYLPGNGKAKAPPEEEEAVPCDLHFIVGCQSCSAWDKQDQEESDDDAGWMSHQLTFEKDRLGKDLEWKRKNEQELLVIDPREKTKELKEKGKAKRREWDA